MNLTNKAIVFFLLLFFFTQTAQGVMFYVTNPSPSNGETNISYASDANTCVDIDPANGCTMDLHFYSNSTGSWTEYQTHLNKSKGTYCGTFAIDCGTTYYWNVSSRMNCSGTYYWENHSYTFTSTDCPVSHIEPVNNSNGLCPCCICLCAKLTNLTGPMIKMEFQSNYTGSWTSLEDARNVPANETYCLCAPEFVWYNMTYYWRVIYNEGYGANSSDIFHFTTATSNDDCPCGGEAIVEYIQDNGGCRGEIVDSPGFSMISLVFVLGVVMILIKKQRKQQS